MIGERMENEFNELSQRIVEAIESVLKVDVTIMNSEMVRIAGTGKYKKELFKSVRRNTAFDICIRTGDTCIVEDIKASPLCVNCDNIEDCEEKADICVPIRYKEKLIGVIGAVAFNKAQRTKIIENKESYMNFIEKMASLLEAKYTELMISEENQKLSLRMDCILNSMKQVVIYFGKEGEVIYKNQELDILLKRVGFQERDNFPKLLWYNMKRTKLQNAENLENVEIVLNENGRDFVFLADITLIWGKNQKEEYLITLKDYNKIQMKIIRQTEGNSYSIDFDSIISTSSCMEEIKAMAKMVALSGSNILLDGESGTGKEIFARAIHNHSNRSEKPFIPVNCGAIPDMLLESELFGYEKGAFTGADKKKLGKFEIADGGTIFLDEVGELPFRLQAKLLRVLQEREVCRLGSNEIRKVDIRIISATNANLLEIIKLNQFREDLYYRLNIIPIHLPPLRERKEDICFLTEHYIGYYNSLFEKKIQGLSEESKRIFLEYIWPGNIRELQNVLEYAVCLETGPLISAELIGKRIEVNPIERREEKRAKSEITNYRDYEKQQMIQLIEQYCQLKHKKMMDKICEEMNISRSTFYRRSKKYGIQC